MEETALRIVKFALILIVALALPAQAYDPSQHPAPAGTSHYEVGRMEVHKGNWERAAERFRAAVADDGKDYKAYTLLGYSLRHAGKVREAIAAYGRALALRPDYTEALEYRGKALLIAGDRKGAERDYRALVRLGYPAAADLKAEIEKVAIKTR